MDAIDEVNSRSKLYFDEDKVPIEDYNVMNKSDKKEIINIVWNEEGLKSLDSTVPNAFKSFVKKAIEKKAREKGYNTITKEIFLVIKKESGIE